MCKGTTAGEGALLLREQFHERIQSIYTKDIAVDRCIAEEVQLLLSQGIVTIGHSCCGHGKEQAQVWIDPESVDKAKQLGYRVFTAYTMDGTANPAIMLKSGTQSDVLQYEGYVHGDENGMIDGKLPPKRAMKAKLGWSESL